MPRLQTPRPPNASLARRELLIFGAAAALGACRAPPITAAHTPPLDMQQLNRAIGEAGLRARPGVLGVGLMNLDSGETFALNGERRFPMQGVFEAPLGAAALAEVDAGRLSLDETLVLKEMDLSPPDSPIADAWPTRRDYTVRQLLVAAVGQGDNTAADLLMARIGGPGAVTAWLAGKRIDEVRVDRYQRDLQTEMLGMAPFRPAWKGDTAYLAALRTVPPALQRAASLRYLSDPRDTATPRGMLAFLAMLDDGELVSPASARLLRQTMIASPAGPRRLQAGLPKGAVLAHTAGTARTVLGMNPATNDVGVVTLPDRRKYALAVFLTGATLDDAGRDGVIADVARAVTQGVR